jgi:hypothetical protein
MIPAFSLADRSRKEAMVLKIEKYRSKAFGAVPSG